MTGFPMTTPGYVRTMAAYNAEMNRRLYAAAAGLPDDVRRVDGGVFWGSLHATFCHLLWADRMWMSRFAGWPKPVAAQPGGTGLIEEYAPLTAARVAADADILAWSEGVTQDWLDAEQTWFSGITQREMHARRDMLVLHMFNHQTHHRGQAHALLTRAGQATGDTDLWLVLPAA